MFADISRRNTDLRNFRKSTIIENIRAAKTHNTAAPIMGFIPPLIALPDDAATIMPAIVGAIMININQKNIFRIFFPPFHIPIIIIYLDLSVDRIFEKLSGSEGMILSGADSTGIRSRMAW